MRRPLRILLNAATVLSLVLCVATAGLWVRSYWRFDDLGANSTWRDASGFTQRVIRLGSNKGRFLFTDRDISFPWTYRDTTRIMPDWERHNGVYFSHEPPIDLYRQFPRQPGEQSWTKDFAGCRLRRILELTANHNTVGVVVIVPHAYACAGFAILPALFARRWRRARRGARLGLCRHCGYDLRATPDRCPECGAVTTTKAPSPGATGR
jgi:hypothetical protein